MGNLAQALLGAGLGAASQGSLNPQIQQLTDRNKRQSLLEQINAVGGIGTQQGLSLANRFDPSVAAPLQKNQASQLALQGAQQGQEKQAAIAQQRAIIESDDSTEIDRENALLKLSQFAPKVFTDTVNAFELNTQRKKNLASDILSEIKPLTDENRISAIDEGIKRLRDLGMDKAADGLEELKELDAKEGNELIGVLQVGLLDRKTQRSLLKAGQGFGGKSVRQKEFESLVRKAGLSPEDEMKAARIGLRLDAGAVGSADQTVALNDLTDLLGESKGKIAADIVTAKGEAGIPVKQQEGILQSNIKRIATLTEDSNKRKSSIKKGQVFLDAFKAGTASSGATRSALGFVPGVFTSQAQFDERLNAFSEVAARAALKANGEIRPTDADVEGMKRAMFGVGRDEDTNIQLLTEFLSDLEDQNVELENLKSSRKLGTLSTFTIGNDLSLKEQAELDELRRRKAGQ